MKFTFTTIANKFGEGTTEAKKVLNDLTKLEIPIKDWKKGVQALCL
jgi:hypothetical protein